MQLFMSLFSLPREYLLCRALRFASESVATIFKKMIQNSADRAAEYSLKRADRVYVQMIMVYISANSNLPFFSFFLNIYIIMIPWLKFFVCCRKQTLKKDMIDPVRRNDHPDSFPNILQVEADYPYKNANQSQLSFSILEIFQSNNTRTAIALEIQ
jgi:hypothetical protein